MQKLYLAVEVALLQQRGLITFCAHGTRRDEGGWKHCCGCATRCCSYQGHCIAVTLHQGSGAITVHQPGGQAGRCSTHAVGTILMQQKRVHSACHYTMQPRLNHGSHDLCMYVRQSVMHADCCISGAVCKECARWTFRCQQEIHTTLPAYTIMHPHQ